MKSSSFFPSPRCNVDSKVSRVAWLNRTTILFAGKEKWSLDPRVVLMENTAVTEYSVKIQNVDVHDEGPYVCSILTNKKPKSTKVHLIVQGKMSLRGQQHEKNQSNISAVWLLAVYMLSFSPGRSVWMEVLVRLQAVWAKSNQIRNLSSSVLGWAD